MMAEKRRRRAHRADIAQDARAERERIEGGAVPRNRGLGLGAADQIAPDLARQSALGGGDEFVQRLEAFSERLGRFLGFLLMAGLPSG